jgi:hypothetical protein
MSGFSELPAQTDVRKSWFSKHTQNEIDPALQGSRRKLPLKDSLFACGFLGLYLALYLAAGFAGIKAIGWIWSTIFS